MWKNICHYIFSSLLSKIERSVLLKNIFSLYKSKSQNGNFLWLDKNFVSYYFASFMTLKTKTSSFYDNKNFASGSFNSSLTSKPKRQFLCFDKTFVPCSFPSFIAIKFEMGIF